MTRNRIQDLRYVRASDLKRNDKNWRKHPQKQQDAIQSALNSIGIVDAVIARELPDGTLELVDGHLRSDTLGDEEIPVLVVDLSEEEADLVLATFDPLSAMARTGADEFRSLRDRIKSNDIEVPVSDALRRVLNSVLPDRIEMRDADPQESPEGSGDTPGEARVRRGDIWHLGEHVLVCGDCRDRGEFLSAFSHLGEGEKIQTAITSPPYASQRKYDGKSDFRPIPPEKYVEWFQDVSLNVQSMLAEAGSFFLNIKEHCEEGSRSLYVKDLTIAHVREWGWVFVEEYIWKHAGTPKAPRRRLKNTWEPVFHFTRGGDHNFYPEDVRYHSSGVPVWNDSPKVVGSGEGMGGVQGDGDPMKGCDREEGLAYPGNCISIATNSERVGHPAVFPLKLPEFFIRLTTQEGEVVYDPFTGSGTTLIASENLGRRYTGHEISPKYCALAIRRWEKLTGGEAKLEFRES